MRTLLTMAAIGCLVIAPLGATAKAQGQIPWLTDWRKARDLAQEQHRLVLLHFWSESCAPCKQLEVKVFNRPEVVRAMHSGYIPVKVNVDQDSRLAEHYGVDRWPTDVIVDAKGRVIHRDSSPPEPHQYVAFLDSIKTHHAVAMLTSQPATSQPNGPPTGDGRAAASPTDSTSTLGAPRRGSSFVPSNQGSTNFHKPAPEMTPSRPDQVAGNAAQNPLNSRFSSQPARVGKPYANPFLTGPANNDNPPADATGNAGLIADTAALGSTAAAPQANPQQGWQQPNSTPAAGFRAPSPQSSPVMPNQYTTNNSATGQPESPANNAWGGQATRQAMLPANPQLPPLPTQSDTFGLESYCPVTLVEKNTWTRGDQRWGMTHRGRTYLFATPDAQQRFFANPDAYAPILAGYDPVQYMDAGMVVEGKRRHGLYYGSKYFLFADESALQKFQSNPNRYIPGDVMR